ncbi:MAG: hypothetical protein KDB99_14805 [Chitinophagaceae bacterium]|nr:hypothetical protein [Chitinophagaceae bacterium]
MKNISWLLLVFLSACSYSQQSYRTRIDLRGSWQFALDTGITGIQKQWFLRDLSDTILLPGTTDLRQKGFLNTDTTTLHLNRLYTYEGAAWYRKKVIIPESFRNKHITLHLERTRSSSIWVDDQPAGSSHLLQSPQQFDVSALLKPGVHYISIMINNDLRLTPYGNVHIYSDDTQTNWNGILGEIYVEASSPTYIRDLQVFADTKQNKIDVKLDIAPGTQKGIAEIVLAIEKTVNGRTTKFKSQHYQRSIDSIQTLSYVFTKTADLWDDYEQPIYKIMTTVSIGKEKDVQTAAFSMRNFKAEGTQFAINGRTTFLRGKHEAAVFPLTGFPPMDVGEWKRVFRIAKNYGINHYRFHSYCPPEAAFTAADEEGIFLQAELPFWGGLESDTVAQMLQAEGMSMLKAYANHPSFVMFSPGNEIWAGHEKVEQVMESLKAYDSRPLYTMGSNNNIGYAPPRPYCDFFIGARVPQNGDSIIGHTRLTHAFADAREGGILNTQYPSTQTDFSFAVSHMNIPLVSHEIGQYQVYPNFKEIKKYTGVLKPRNLEAFKKRLFDAGMAGMDSIFQKASGTWSAICYKAEVEAALRTPGMAGFQLLDLQDFPGQGTALVGMLDAFMDSKEVVSTTTWKQSCNDVTLLLSFPKYCWTNAETFEAQVKVANYSNHAISSALQYEISKQDETILDKGTLSLHEVAAGNLVTVGEIKEKLTGITAAEKILIRVFIPGTNYSNEYSIWVYPPASPIVIPEGITVSNYLTDDIYSQLVKGASVLLFPDAKDIEENSYAGLFNPEFWNYGMFKKISESVKKPVSPGTLGILTNPSHPLFKYFPTDFHTNWQWFSIIQASRSLILDSTQKDYYPIVQVIDNLERDHKLGLIFEFKVGEGKLLVCLSALLKLVDKPEAVQLYRSILQYMRSADFNPGHRINRGQLEKLLK